MRRSFTEKIYIVITSVVVVLDIKLYTETLDIIKTLTHKTTKKKKKKMKRNVRRTESDRPTQ